MHIRVVLGVYRKNVHFHVTYLRLSAHYPVCKDRKAAQPASVRWCLFFSLHACSGSPWSLTPAPCWLTESQLDSRPPTSCSTWGQKRSAGEKNSVLKLFFCFFPITSHCCHVYVILYFLTNQILCWKARKHIYSFDAWVYCIYLRMSELYFEMFCVCSGTGSDRFSRILKHMLTQRR